MSVVLSDKLAECSPFKLRIIPFDALSGRDNMAIDHYLALLCENDMPPTIRFYNWHPYCLSIGYHQNSTFIDHERLREEGFEFVRRPTGGKAIFHSEELTYSVIFPKRLFNQKRLYAFVHVLLARALNVLGYGVELANVNSQLPKFLNDTREYACFTNSAYSEIQYKNKKVVGSAQRIYKKSILQHGSILIGNTHERLISFLKATPDQKQIILNNLKNKTICLNAIKNLATTPDQIVKAILKELEFNERISVYSEPLNHKELERARRIWQQQM